MLSLMDAIVSLVVKVLWRFISLVCFRVYLKVSIHKNPTHFNRWSVRLNKEERRRLLFKLEEADNFLKYYSIADVMEEEDDDSVFIEVERGYEFIKNGGELVLNYDYSLISDIYTLADILSL